VIEEEVVVQDGHRDRRPSTGAVGVVVKRMVRRVIPKYFCGGCCSGRICDEMRRVERTGVGAAERQTTPECLMIEGQHITLAIMATEVSDVIDAIGDRGVSKTVSPGTSGQGVGTTLAF